uniref:hypothetical protein n=1 Tax=Pseudomonas sp. K-62 TaxID=76885 RepID=UPI00159ED368|nr:hypothetical protein [Pseudomonas sp. K-62]
MGLRCKRDGSEEQVKNGLMRSKQRFRRRSIVVSKSKRMVDVSLALFARFSGNSRISDLLSILT